MCIKHYIFPEYIDLIRYILSTVEEVTRERKIIGMDIRHEGKTRNTEL